MITTKIIKEWIDLYVNQHMNCNQIAKLYNVNRLTVKNYLNLRGIATPKPKTHSCHNEFHKGKYMICIYNLQDSLVWQFNTAKEMAETLNKPLTSILSHLNEKRIHMKFRHNDKWYRIYLVEVDKDEL